MRILLWQGFFNTYGQHYLLIAMTVALSLIGVVTFGTFAGIPAAFLAPAARIRSRQRQRTLRRHAGRRDRADHLLHHRCSYLARNIAVGPRPSGG